MGILALIAICSLIGFGTIVTGLRARSVPCSPACAHCGYDLRGYAAYTRCSECGKDLNTRDAIRTTLARPSRKKILAGLLIAAAPWCLIALLTFLQWLGPNWERLRSNQSLLAMLGHGQSDQAWLWMALTRRLRAGMLSNAEAQQAIDQLIVINQQSHTDADWAFRFGWANSFIWTAENKGVITPAEYLALGQLCYGKTPVIEFPNGVQERYGAQFWIKPSGQWWRHLPGVSYNFTLLQLSMSGPAARTEDILHRPGQGSMLPPDINLLGNNAGVSLAPNVPAVRYILKAVVQTNLLSGSGSSGWKPTLTPPAGITTLARWTETIQQPIDVSQSYSASTPRPMVIRTDAEADPQKCGAISVSSAEALCYSDKTVVIFHLKIGSIPVACWLARTIVMEGRRFNEGSRPYLPGMVTYDDVFSCELGPLAEKKLTASLELVPDLDSAKKGMLEKSGASRSTSRKFLSIAASWDSA